MTPFKKKQKHLFSLFFILLSQVLFAQTEHKTELKALEILDNTHEYYPLEDYIKVYHDKDKNKTIKEISAASFLKNFTNNNYDSTTDEQIYNVFWAVLRVNKISKAANLFYLYQNAFCDSISVFQKDKSEVYRRRTTGYSFKGDALNYAGHPFAMSFNDKIDTLYIRLVRGPYSGRVNKFNLKLSNAYLLESKSKYISYFDGFFQGIILIIILYNIVFYISILDTTYFAFSFFSLGLLVYYGRGIYEIFNIPQQIIMCLINFAVILVIAGSYAVIKYYLNLKTNAPSLLKLMFFFVLYSCFVQLLVVLFYWSTFFTKINFLLILMRTSNYSILVNIFLAAVAIIYSVAIGNKPAKIFLAASSFYIIGVTIQTLETMGLIHKLFNFPINVAQIGMLFQIVIFSIALANQIQTIRKAKERAQLEVLETLQENEKIIRNQNIILEHKVQERTVQLLEEKKEVEKQKELVDEKNKEILQSITYAQRLQDAILPPLRIVKEFLKESFILYKPKDIVAGDFYWMETKENGLVLFAAADCTGHGVPGAMVSVVCSNALNRAVKEFKLIDPGLILNKVRELVIETFSKSETNISDGMDISLCVIDINTLTLNWSGANNPLWIIRNESGRLEEIKPDKQPIGQSYSPKPFTTHSFQLTENDCFYVFTDGYQDQFGGDENFSGAGGKKFKPSKMKELLLANYTKPMNEQKNRLNETFQKWKGSLEQVDDICIIGVRV